MWCFETPVILLLVCYISLCDAQVTLKLCDPPIKDEICVLECHTPDLTQSVVFKKDNTEYASCKFILGTLICTSIYPLRSLISQQINVTSLNITQLSRAGDQGSWACDYGSTGSSAETLTVLTAPKQRVISPDVDIDFCTGNQSDSQNITLIVHCSSQVEVTAKLNSTSGLYTEDLSVNKYPACSDVAENIYTAVFTITNTTGNLTGSGYNLTFTTKLTALSTLPESVRENYMYETPYTSDISLACTITTTTGPITTTTGPVTSTPDSPNSGLVVLAAAGVAAVVIVVIVIIVVMRRRQERDKETHLYQNQDRLFYTDLHFDRPTRNDEEERTAYTMLQFGVQHTYSNIDNVHGAEGVR